MSKADRAKRLLTHYFQTAFEASGKQWDGDTVAEVEEIIDLIIEAATEPAS